MSIPKNISDPGFLNPLTLGDNNKSGEVTSQGGQGSQGDNVILHLIGNLLTDQSNQSDQSSKGLKIFENLSVVGGSFLSPKEMERFRGSSKEIFGKAFKTSDVQPKTPTEELEEQRQEIRDFYLREKRLHALTGHLAGSEIFPNLNKFINNLGLEDAKLLMDQMRLVVGMIVAEQPGELFAQAVFEGKSLFVQFLCAAGQDCPAVLQGMYYNNNTRYGHMGTTLLMTAVRLGNLDIMNALLDVDKGHKGTERSIVNMQGERGLTALMHATSLEMVRALIDAGADVDMQALNRDTALIIFSVHEIRQRKECVEALLKAHANVNVQGRNGRTALMVAAEHGHVDVLQTLITARRDPGLNLDLDARDNWGRTAVDCAHRHDEAVRRILLEAGAHPADALPGLRPGG